jgi:hypothetical protein
MEPGKFYLFSCPFYWTFVARFRKQLNFQELLVEDAIYFTRPGATFDVLCHKGLVRSGSNKSQYHGPFPELIIPAHPTVKFPWLAETPWVVNYDK